MKNKQHLDVDSGIVALGSALVYCYMMLTAAFVSATIEFFPDDDVQQGFDICTDDCCHLVFQSVSIVSPQTLFPLLWI